MASVRTFLSTSHNVAIDFFHRGTEESKRFMMMSTRICDGRPTYGVVVLFVEEAGAMVVISVVDIFPPLASITIRTSGDEPVGTMTAPNDSQPCRPPERRESSCVLVQEEP